MGLSEGILYKKIKEGKVQCRMCSHFCLIEPGQRGTCGVRENREGELYTHVRNRVAAANIDPVEKKPLFHFLPGTQTFSIGTMGCNFSCSFCQNSTLSQTPKESGLISGETFSGDKIAEAAVQARAGSVSYTYSEPTVFTELVLDTARLARASGLKNILVSNGFQSPDCLKELGPYIDAANIDLKAFTEDFYRDYCGARLEPVLKTLKKIKELGWWLEITTLVITDLNDSGEELKRIAGFIAEELGSEVPWHISRFHPTYKMTDRPSTPVERLEKAWELGKEAGLQFVYTGNVFGHDGENTYCPSCEQLLVRRTGFSAQNAGLARGKCSKCGHKTAGVGFNGLD
ncbi:MAG: AmmeMemoRadiSam system radical SAM enzyme [Desulfonatronovibrionaceae bacterium]